MGWRLGVCVVGLSIALPAWAEQGGTGDGAPVGRLPGGALAAALTPAAPILSSTEGASDSGGSIILDSALYGGLAGAAIGAGVALIEGGNWGRDIGIGAGVGLLAGGVFGATRAFSDSRGPLPTTDGLASTDRDPVISARTAGYAGKF
jgi:hypothetical protein